MMLSGRSVIITGASRGIGEAIATLFAEQGANLLLIARSESVYNVAARLQQEGQTIVALQGDVTSENDVQQLVKTFRKTFKVLDVLVNNAGIMEPGLLGMTDMAMVRRMLEVNVVAMINLTQYAIRLMTKAAHPTIVNLASIAGTEGIAGIGGYCSSKAAVVGFTNSAAKELAPRNIRVNAIAPGFIDTEMTRSLSPEWYQKRVEGIRLGQCVGSPQDVANCALFLASGMSNYVTGQVIGVDGGMIA